MKRKRNEIRLLIFFLSTLFIPAVFAQEYGGTSWRFSDDDPRDAYFYRDTPRDMVDPGKYESPPDPLLESRKTGREESVFQKLWLDACWVPSGGQNGLGMTRLNAGVTFALPGPKCPWTQRTFFLLTPGFDYTHVDWKQPTAFPDSLFRAGLSVSWIQEINPRWMIMAGASPAWAGDGKATRDTVRCPAYVGAAWTPNSHWKFVLGVSYLARNDMLFLPFGGVIWTPNENWTLELTAPKARVARRLAGLSDAVFQNWIYVAGGLDGNAWAVRSTAGEDDYAMYREYSIQLGYECVRNRTQVWSVEIGVLFWRKMEFEHHTQRTVEPNNAVFLRTKVAF